MGRRHLAQVVRRAPPPVDRLAGVADGDPVAITAGAVTITAPAAVTERVPEGAMFVSSLLQGGAVAQMLTGEGGLPRVSLAKPVIAVSVPA